MRRVSAKCQRKPRQTAGRGRRDEKDFCLYRAENPAEPDSTEASLGATEPKVRGSTPLGRVTKAPLRRDFCVRGAERQTIFDPASTPRNVSARTASPLPVPLCRKRRA